ncbi:hypothetical protein [Fervidibacillus albus]|uniref:Uncharacterized protein n=1 Tax=Fervidibacillus albus TaxID=2980026 RepID=A0A9E8LY24_9BACI|nr:hypothetical protein [Fervidibacillus albus]WAA11156.1 hypothetical protein OE104_07655 [Fervidibacillus albus]
MKKKILLGLGTVVLLVFSLSFYMYDQTKYTTFGTAMSDLKNKMESDNAKSISKLIIDYMPTIEEYQQGIDYKYVIIEDEEQINRIFNRIVEETANMEVKETKERMGLTKLKILFFTKGSKYYSIRTTEKNIISNGIKKYKIIKNNELQNIIDSENLDWILD